MLPLILQEKQTPVFKFWFNGEMRDGMCHQSELFCRIRTFDGSDRGRVYHLACKLAGRERLIALTFGEQDCSLWVSLRDPLAEAVLLKAKDFVLP